MKRASIAVAVLVALTLTGCAGTGGGTSDGSTERVNTASEEATTAPETSEPLVAETPGATDAGSDADEGFLKYVHDELPPNTTIGDASDEQLIAAGHEACEQVESGVAWEDIRLVEGEEPTPTGYYMDTSAILNGALYNYCPDLIPAVD